MQISVNLKYKSYNVLIKKGLRHSISKILKDNLDNKKIIVITDENLYNFYHKTVIEDLRQNFNTSVIVITPGEMSKSFSSLIEIYNKLLDFKITRDDLIVAFGGGVTGDIAGFVASTILRGVKFVQIPTSLISQIDSSIGGKVAVNLPRAKNIVGSFYHPELVLIDPVFLNTLDKKYLEDGMGEVIKCGCIRDEGLFNKLSSYDTYNDLLDDSEYIIYECCKIKKSVVEEDEKDFGSRMLLNFGHTIGHAIEKYYDYNKYSHGEAVAIGMYNITKKSEKVGLTEYGTSEKIKRQLLKFNLPYNYPKNTDIDQLVTTAYLDKKNRSNHMNIVLLKRIGKSFIKRIQKDEIKNYF